MEEQKGLKELKVLENEGIPVKKDAEVVVAQGAPKEPEKEAVPIEITISVTLTPEGYMVSKIQGEFPLNDIFIRGVLDQAKNMIITRMMQKRIQAEMSKSKIVKPDIMGSLRQAGKKVGSIFK